MNMNVKDNKLNTAGKLKKEKEEGQVLMWLKYGLGFFSAICLNWKGYTKMDKFLYEQIL